MRATASRLTERLAQKIMKVLVREGQSDLVNRVFGDPTLLNQLISHLQDVAQLVSGGTEMNETHEREIIRTLVAAGHEGLAKRFALSRGYRVKGAHHHCHETHAGADLYCPNCGARLGKQIEVEHDFGPAPKGKVIDIYCDNCGQTFRHRTEYDTREPEAPPDRANETIEKLLRDLANEALMEWRSLFKPDIRQAPFKKFKGQDSLLLTSRKVLNPRTKQQLTFPTLRLLLARNPRKPEEYMVQVIVDDKKNVLTLRGGWDRIVKQVRWAYRDHVHTPGWAGRTSGAAVRPSPKAT